MIVLPFAYVPIEVAAIPPPAPTVAEVFNSATVESVAVTCKLTIEPSDNFTHAVTI